MSNIPADQIKLQDSIFVIFGITGDLAKRYLLPALYELIAKDQIPEKFSIVGLTRRDIKIEEILEGIRQKKMSNNDEINERALNKLGSCLELVKMEISENQDYSKLASTIQKIDDDAGKQLNRLYYLAVPPEMYGSIVGHLKSHSLHACNDRVAEARLLIEKPFGYDTKTALDLIKVTEKAFPESAIYRVDHYLAKETAQNIMTFRFDNPLFESVWDNQTVDHILITGAEKIDVQGRGNFYDSTGAMRDFIQSHLLQLLALITMERPSDRSADEIHKTKLKLLESILPIEEKDVYTQTVRGQYKGYKQETKNPNSYTETYAAIKLTIDNKRWKNVPILMRTGKSLTEKITEINIVFKNPLTKSKINALTIRIQPNEGIVISLHAKKPSLSNETELVHMQFFYDQAFNVSQPDAYERVLIDAIRGDKTLFTTDAEMLTSWKIIEDVLKVWSSDGTHLFIYEPGSWGPVEADEFADRYGAKWLTGSMPIQNATQKAAKD